MTYLHRIEDPLLAKQFQAFLSDSDGVQTFNSLQEMDETLLLDRFKFHFISLHLKSLCTYLNSRSIMKILNCRLMLLSQSMSEHLPLDSRIERAVLRLSSDWESIAGALVADILIREHQLWFHLHSAQSVLMLQASHKLQPFLSHLFKLVCIYHLMPIRF